MISDDEYGEDLNLVNTWENKVQEARKIVFTYGNKVDRALVRIKEYERVQMMLPKIKEGLTVYYSASANTDHFYFSAIIKEILNNQKIIISKKNYTREISLSIVFLEKQKNFLVENLWEEEKRELRRQEDSEEEKAIREQIKKKIAEELRNLYNQR